MMKASMMILYGDTDKCFRNFVEKAGNCNAESVKMLADFVGISREAAQKWMIGQRTPIGENLISLRYFLDNIGYRVEELETLTPEVRQLGLAFVQKKTTIDDMASLLGYSRESIFRIILGKQVPMKDKADEIKEILSALDMLPAEDKIPKVINFDSRTEQSILNDDAVISMLGSHINGMTPLIKHLLSDQCSPATRKKFREVIGINNIYDFSDIFRKLLSEASRNGYHEGKPVAKHD